MTEAVLSLPRLSRFLYFCFLPLVLMGLVEVWDYGRHILLCGLIMCFMAFFCPVNACCVLRYYSSNRIRPVLFEREGICIGLVIMLVSLYLVKVKNDKKTFSVKWVILLPPQWLAQACLRSSNGCSRFILTMAVPMRLC